MRWPWQKKFIQWKPRPGLLPHPRIIAQQPDLKEIDQNPHFRMTAARSIIPSALNPVVAALVCIPWIVYPWFIYPLLGSGAPGKSDLEWFMAVSAIWLYLALHLGFQNHQNAPFGGTWNKKYFLPSDRDILLDYVTIGISPATIVRGLQAIDFRRDLFALKWTMSIIGLTTPVFSYMLHPTREVYWSRLVIFGLALLRVGPMLWPTGISAFRVYRAAKSYKSQLDMRRRPLRYAGRMVLLLLLVIVISVVVILAIIVIAGVLDKERLWRPLWRIAKAISPLVLLPGVLAAGIYYARMLLTREQKYLDLASDIVREVLEWKREELFEKGGGK